MILKNNLKARSIQRFRQESLGVETPKETERKIFDPKVYEFDTQPYTRVPEEFDLQQYINGFSDEGNLDHQHHAEEKDVKGKLPYVTSDSS